MFVLLVALGTLLGARPAEAQPTRYPPGAPIIPNASVVTAKVLKYSILDATLLHFRVPQTLYSLVLEVTASENVADIPNLVNVGDQIEAFTKGALTPDLFGRTIRATIRARGDEWGQRFWIQEIGAVGD